MKLIARFVWRTALGIGTAAAACAQAPSLWQVRDSGTTANLYGVAQGAFLGGKRAIVAVGDNGTILSSFDSGVTWSSDSSGTTETLTSVAYSQALFSFFAVGTAGTILSSTDAQTWVREASPTTARFNSVSSGAVDGTIYAVGDAGVGLLVRDATHTWTQTDPGFGNRSMNFISSTSAVGQGGTWYQTSDKGVTWVAQTSGTTADLYAIDGAVMVGASGFGVGISSETFHGLLRKAGASVPIYPILNSTTVGEYFAVGSDGVIFRRGFWTGADWTPSSNGWIADATPTKHTLNAVCTAIPPSSQAGVLIGPTDDGVIAVGDGGTILLHAPTPPSITVEPVAGQDSDGQPYVEAQAGGDGVWSTIWLGRTAERFPTGLPLGNSYPRQVWSGTPASLANTFMQFAVGNAFGVVMARVIANRTVNLSGRALVGAGENVLIGGFSSKSYTLNGAQRLLIRAVGPSLQQFGVTHPLLHPKLTVLSGSKVLATNTGWQSSSDPSQVIAAAQQVGAFPFDPNLEDSAVVMFVPNQGHYTAVVESADGATGVAMVEIYDLGNTNDFRLANLSTRARVESGEKVLIGGLVVQGGLKRNYLLRAVGPTMQKLGITTPLATPRLSLYKGDTLIATAGPWQDQSNATDIAAAAASVGAFALPSGSADAAMLLPLDGGNYTLQVTGDNGTTGIALVEAYEAP